MSVINIAIDGPSGAGKSTLAKALAKELGYLYVDTGAMYRTVSLFAQRKGIDPKDAERIIGLLDQIKIEMDYGEDGTQRMLLNGEDVTMEIRKDPVSMYTSHVSALPEVRAYLTVMQQEIARGSSVIMDGRDIGTVVLPEAQVKLFLTAAPEDRARRRYEELIGRGEAVDYEDILRKMIARDENDSQRAAAPLRQAEDATLVDTTGLDQQESLQLLLKIIKEKLS